MNKNLIIAFLIGVIIALVAVNYLSKFDIKIEMAKKTEPVNINETQNDDSFLNETTEIVNNTISKNKKIEEKPSNELKIKEEKTNPLDKYLPNKDKYKDLENNQYTYSEPAEVEERTDPFDMPDRPKAIKEADIPRSDIPQPKRPEMRSESVSIPDFGGTQFGKFSVLTDGDVLPILQVPPQYPRRATQRCMEGWVMVEYTVTETGAVINPLVLDAEPPGIFNRSALRAMAKWKYKPRIVEGKAVSRKDLQRIISYELGSEGCQKRTKLSDLRQPKYIESNLNSINKTKPQLKERRAIPVNSSTGVKKATRKEIKQYKKTQNSKQLLIDFDLPKYPRRAKQREIEGWVLYEYTVSESGTVINPRVVDSDPPGIFNRSVLRAAVEWKYLTAKKNGIAVETTGVRHVSTYTLEDRK